MHESGIAISACIWGNNWYYAYGKSSREQIVKDSKFISSLASSTSNRPYMVIDDGWQMASVKGACKGGPWTGNSLFPDMPGLAGEMKAAGVRPGIWCRPLMWSDEVPDEWVRYVVDQNDRILILAILKDWLIFRRVFKRFPVGALN